MFIVLDHEHNKRYEGTQKPSYRPMASNMNSDDRPIIPRTVLAGIDDSSVCIAQELIFTTSTSNDGDRDSL
jgi:hypothetical protein